MRRIMVLNAKGGCGKTTIATNIASHYAKKGRNVVLADFDPQLSSLDWLLKRDESRPPITGLDAVNNPLRVPNGTEIVIFDVNAGVMGRDLTAMVRRAETILLPVLPSPIDIRAGTKYIQELLLVGKVSRDQTKIGLIANRVKENSTGYERLQTFLKNLKIPIVATLRDTQNYIRASERGLGIFDMRNSAVEHDVDQWKPIITWLNSKKSLPKNKKAS
ncbi:MAG: AAA family ATPase [Gammaproteobacteria bacterium]|jgi:chromosome partitioning protein